MSNCAIIPRVRIPPTHSWNISPQAAIQIQRELAARVSARDEFGAIRFVAGVDVGFEGARNSISHAAIVVLKFPELAPIESATARRPVTFPYVPGLLAFREIPVILDALARIETEPDVWIVDGHGRAHPRRFGIACHLGVLLNRATIGCAKSVLCGKAQAPAQKIGAWTPLLEKGEAIGAAVRTRPQTTPVYVSVGHRISLPSAVELVLKCGKGYRVPETTRYAHRVASGARL